MLKQRKENLMLLAASLLCGLVAALLANAYLGKDHKPSTSAKETAIAAPQQPVVVLSRDIARGEALQAADLRVIELPKEIAGTLPLADPAMAVGRIAVQPLYAGEWLLEQKLASDQTRNRGVIGLLDDGRRGMRIPADRVNGLLGVLQPGDHVDVIAVLPKPDGQNMFSRTLLQNVTVLAVGQVMTVDPAGGTDEAADAALRAEGNQSSIVLDVTPEQAEALALVLQAGKLQLVARGGVDTTPVHTRGADLANLFNRTQTSAALHSIEIHAGKYSRTEVVNP